MCLRLGELQGVGEQMEEHNKGDTEETVGSHLSIMKKKFVCYFQSEW